MSTHDDAPLTSRSGGAQMHERPASFSRAGEASDRAMQNLQEPAESGKGGVPTSGRSSFVISLLRALRGVYMPTDEKMVLVVLADHAQPDGTSFPSQETIARETGLGLTKLGDALRALAKHGWLTRHRELDGGRIWAHTVYRLRLDGQPWPPPCRPPRGGKPRSDRQPSGTDHDNRRTEPQPPDGFTVNRPTAMREPSDGDRVNRPAPTKPPEEKLTDQAPRREAPIDAPPAAAAAPNAGMVKGQTTIPFEPSPEPRTTPKTGRKRDARTLPAEWRPTEAHYVKGAGLGFDRAKVNDEAERFRDRAIAKEERYVDWDAAFRVWLSKAKDFAPKPRYGRTEVDDFARPQDSDNWPEARLIPDAVYYPPPVRDDPPDPERDAEVAALAKLPIAELERRIERARGLHGVGS